MYVTSSKHGFSGCQIPLRRNEIPARIWFFFQYDGFLSSIKHKCHNITLWLDINIQVQNLISQTVLNNNFKTIFKLTLIPILFCKNCDGYCFTY